MCFPFSFGGSGSRKRKSASAPAEKKRRDGRPHSEVLRGNGAVVADVDEKRRPSSDRQRKTRSKGSPRREKEEVRYAGTQSHHQHQQYTRSPNDVYRSRAQYRTPLNVEVPTMWHRAVDHPTGSNSNSSTEMLLNPRPQRTQHTRQRHPKQATLRGHGAKREKSRKEMRQQPSSGWSLFGPSTSSPPRTPRRRDRDASHYKTLDSTSSPRSHRSSRSHRASTSHTHQADPSSSSSAAASPPRSTTHQHHPRSQRSRPSTHASTSHARPSTSSSRARPAAPQNTSARRIPDRRFAVLAATNTALEDLRREAFAQATPPPPPRRERLRRYQGVTLPAASIPYTWDCVSSSRESAAGGGGVGAGESSRRGRRGR